jgi:hypothetical protein
MKKEQEYDTDKLTPENSWEKIVEYVNRAEVGSVEFSALCDAFEWRASLNILKELRRITEMIKSGDGIPESLRDLYKNPTTVESQLRVAETVHALAEFNIRRNESTVPGYANAAYYSMEAIINFEKSELKIKNVNLPDQTLEQIQKRDEALDSLRETIALIKTGKWDTLR